ncbi:MAG: hypothetical protein IT383_29110 [Deltaproteobacteria bacterium]|nr:hypothetical protein [Deltaproteobacteria bacterium]
MTTLAAAILAGLASVLLVHELGHVVAALLCGGRVERVQWRGLSARVIAELPDQRAQLLFFLAGALATASCALLLGALAFVVESPTMALVMGLVAGMHLAHAAFALWPSGESDGARLRALLCGEPSSQGER